MILAATVTAVSLASSGVPGFEMSVGPCHDPSDPWCLSDVTCTTDFLMTPPARFTRISVAPNQEPVDTSNVDWMDTVCESYGLHLPSIHSDLDNQCAYEAGVHGSKGTVAIGLMPPMTPTRENGVWWWSDMSVMDYTQFPPGTTGGGDDGLCARISSTLQWLLWPCDLSGIHDNKNYIVCGPMTKSTTAVPTRDPTAAPSAEPTTPVPTTTEPTTTAPTATPTKSPKMVDNSASSDGEDKTGATHAYWAAPLAIAAIIAAAVLYTKMRKESQESVDQNKPIVEHFDYEVKNGHAYEYDGVSIQSDGSNNTEAFYSQISVAEQNNNGTDDDDALVGSDDEDGYMKPTPVYDLAQAGQDQDESEDDEMGDPYDSAL